PCHHGPRDLLLVCGGRRRGRPANQRGPDFGRAACGTARRHARRPPRARQRRIECSSPRRAARARGGPGPAARAEGRPARRGRPGLDAAAHGGRARPRGRGGLPGVGPCRPQHADAAARPAEGPPALLP
ncbi:unnamed protein product, partial [Prorocentrum cordatum]